MIEYSLREQYRNVLKGLDGNSQETITQYIDERLGEESTKGLRCPVIVEPLLRTQFNKVMDTLSNNQRAPINEYLGAMLEEKADDRRRRENRGFSVEVPQGRIYRG